MQSPADRALAHATSPLSVAHLDFRLASMGGRDIREAFGDQNAALADRIAQHRVQVARVRESIVARPDEAVTW